MAEFMSFKIYNAGPDAFRLDLGGAKKKGQVFPFVATVTYSGKISTHMVGGTEMIAGGPYRVMIPRALAESKVDELVGKNVYAAENLQSHDHGNKSIGEFVSAWVEDEGDGVGAVMASGLIYRKSNPELVDKIIEEARAGKLGYSYDLKNASSKLASRESDNGKTEDYLELTDFTWRGATILYRDAAAYAETQLAAMKAEQEEALLEKKELETMLASLFAPIQKDLNDLKTDMGNLRTKQDALEASIKAKPPATPPVTDPARPPVAPAPGGNVVSFANFATELSTQLANANKEAQKPLLDAVEKLTAKLTTPDGGGQRKSLGASEFAAKYIPGYKVGEEVNLDGVEAAMSAVSASQTLTKDQKVAIKLELGRFKRMLLGWGHPAYSEIPGSEGDTIQ